MASSTESEVKSLKLPQFAPERCVHTHITNASCQACVDICHVDAWHLENRELELDTALCDGCGICASVCPETAIEHAHNPLSIQWRNEQLALVACEKIPERLSDQSDGIINCVHALSLRDLINLYAAGHHRLLVSTAPCQDCDRGTTEVLDKHLTTLNSLLKQRGQPPFERININGEQWLNIIRSADHAHARTSLSRREFLRTTASEISDYGLRHFDLKSTEQTAPPPVAKLLPAESNEQVLPYVPEIDIQLCSACDTCIKLCPHDALSLDKQNGEAVYQIGAENCTGCAICIDVCEDEAIQIKLNSIASQQLVALNDCTCQACGVRFHTLDAKGSALCPICQKKKHHTALFQMID